MINRLEELDKSLMLALNGDWAPFLDPAMIAFSEKFFWVPLYLFFLWLCWRHGGWKAAVAVLFMAALTITLSDQLSVKAFKEVFERYRPCHNSEIKHLLYLPTGNCGGLYGFVSSHSMNHFAIATALFLVFRSLGIRYAGWLFVWATLCAYSRVYLGVHYPGDIAAGALCGAAIGLGTGYLFRISYRWIGVPHNRL